MEDEGHQEKTEHPEQLAKMEHAVRQAKRRDLLDRLASLELLGRWACLELLDLLEEKDPLVEMVDPESTEDPDLQDLTALWA